MAAAAAVKVTTITVKLKKSKENSDRVYKFLCFVWLHTTAVVAVAG